MPQKEYIPGTDFFDVPCHAPDPDAHYTCILCGQGTATEIELLRHVAMSHDLPTHLRTQADRFLRTDGVFRCYVCRESASAKQAFVSEEMLVHHLHTMHTDIPGSATG